MKEHRATCSCGALSLACAGEPLRVSMCHCLACQKRTGSAFGVQSRWPRERVKITGTPKTYERVGDSGGTIAFHFCERCGSTVYWTIDAYPEFYAVAVGAFADPTFAAPKVSVYEARRHPWVVVPEDAEHID